MVDAFWPNEMAENAMTVNNSVTIFIFSANHRQTSLANEVRSALKLCSHSNRHY